MTGSLVGKFFRLSSLERGLFVRAVLTLAAARITTWVLPFNVARRLVVARPRSATADAFTPEQIGWAITNAQRLVPQATCLPQALTAESLLHRTGRPAILRIGVKKPPTGKFIAHAWVVSEGRIVVGALPPHEMAEFTPLPPLPSIWPDSGATGR